MADRQQWEYLKLYNLTEAQLNKKGAEGWELVSSTLGEHSERIVTYIFKRPKEDN